MNGICRKEVISGELYMFLHFNLQASFFLSVHNKNRWLCKRDTVSDNSFKKFFLLLILAKFFYFGP